MVEFRLTGSKVLLNCNQRVSLNLHPWDLPSMGVLSAYNNNT